MRCEPATASALRRLEPHHGTESAAAGVAVVVADGGVADLVFAGGADDRRVKARTKPLAEPPGCLGCWQTPELRPGAQLKAAVVNDQDGWFRAGAGQHQRIAAGPLGRQGEMR